MHTSNTSPRIRLPVALALALLGVLALPLTACAAERSGKAPRAANWYVSPKGADTARGTRRAPFRTIQRALAVARPGQSVEVAPGEYGRVMDTRARTGFVTVRGRSGKRGRRAVLDGLLIAGGSYLRFENLRFVGELYTRTHPTLRNARLAHHIEVRDSEFTNRVHYSSVCAFVRDGSHHVKLERNLFHHCRSGIGGPGDGITDPARRIRSRHITIANNWIGPVLIDGIQFGHWEDVKIDGNVIREQVDPTGRRHTDAIQVTGDVHRVRIENNMLSHGNQLLFIEGVRGMNSDVLVKNNLIYRGLNYGAKLQDIDRLAVIDNTIWNTNFGGLLLRTGLTETWAVGNVLASLHLDRSDLDVRGENLIVRNEGVAAASDLVGQSPLFAGLDQDDYRLVPGSPGYDEQDRPGCDHAGYPQGVPVPSYAPSPGPACG